MSRNARTPFAFGVCLILLSAVAHGATPTSFDYLTTGHGESLEQALADPAWQHQDGNYSLGYSNTPHWLRWKLPNDESQVLVIHNAWLDDFELTFMRDARPLAS